MTSTTYYVAAAPTGNDSNNCLSAASPCVTIRSALDKAAVGSTINIAPGTFYEHLVLTKDVMLRGTGASQTIIDGSQNGTVITVQNGTTVTISGTTLQNGLSADLAGTGGTGAGGGINNAGVLTLTNSAVVSNTASGGNSGYGTGGAGGDGLGAGIYNSGSLTVNYSRISGNGANGGAGGSNATYVSGSGGNGLGGGIYNTGVLTMTGSTVSNNTVDGGKGGSGFYGGVAGSGSGAGLFNAGSLYLNVSTLSGNTAIGGVGGNGFVGYGGNGGSGSGGAIYSTGTLAVSNSTLSGNAVNGGTGGIGGSSYIGYGGSGGAGFGGGIYDVNTLTLIQGTIADNHTSGAFGGAGLGYLHNGLSSGRGGGIFMSSTASATLQNTILSSNTDTAGAPDCSGTLASLDYNLIQSTLGCSITGVTTHNLTGADPYLGPLQDNGGPVWTMIPQPGSPALGSGAPTTCQINSGSCDIGAYVPQPLPSSGDTGGGDTGGSDGTATPELGSADLVATGMLAMLGAVLYRRRLRRPR